MKRYLRSRKMLSNLAVLAFLWVWFVTLAPTVVHGPAGYIDVSGHSMDGTYKTGDLILTRRHDTYATGDIIVFKTDSGGQVVQRIIGGDGVRGYTTQGDNNPDPDPWHPTDDQVVGQAWHRFEGKAWILHLPRQPWFAGVTAGLLTLVVLGVDALPKKSRATAVAEPVLRPGTVPAGTEVLEPLAAGVAIPLQRSGTQPGTLPRRVRPSTSLPRRVPPTRPPGTPVAASATTRPGDPS